MGSLLTQPKLHFLCTEHTKPRNIAQSHAHKSVDSALTKPKTPQPSKSHYTNLRTKNNNRIPKPLYPSEPISGRCTQHLTLRIAYSNPAPNSLLQLPKSSSFPNSPIPFSSTLISEVEESGIGRFEEGRILKLGKVVLEGRWIKRFLE